MTPEQIEEQRNECAQRSENGDPIERAIYDLSAGVLEVALQLAIKNNLPAAMDEARRYGALTMRQHIESVILNFQIVQPGAISKVALNEILYDIRAAVNKVPV